jgi:hypothetical protein
MSKAPMLTDIELNVIAGFFPRPHQCLLQYITRDINYPAPDVFNCLRDLGQREIVQWLWLRRVSVFSLNINSDEALEGYLFHVKLRRHKFEQMHSEIFLSIYETAEKLENDAVLLCEKTVGEIEVDDDIVLVEIVETDIRTDMKTEDKTKTEQVCTIRGKTNAELVRSR